MRTRTTNRLVKPGARVRVCGWSRTVDGVRFFDTGYRGVVLERVTNTRRRGPWWFVRQSGTGAVRPAPEGKIVVRRGRP